MEITISIPKRIENALLKRAEDSGQDIRTVVEHIVEISVETEDSQESKQRFKSLLSGLRNGGNVPGADEIAQEVETVREQRYSRKNED